MIHDPRTFWWGLAILVGCLVAIYYLAKLTPEERKP